MLWSWSLNRTVLSGSIRFKRVSSAALSGHSAEPHDAVLPIVALHLAATLHYRHQREVLIAVQAQEEQ